MDDYQILKLDNKYIRKKRGKHLKEKYEHTGSGTIMAKAFFPTELCSVNSFF